MYPSLSSCCLSPGSSHKDFAIDASQVCNDISSWVWSGARERSTYRYSKNACSHTQLREKPWTILPGLFFAGIAYTGEVATTVVYLLELRFVDLASKHV